MTGDSTIIQHFKPCPEDHNVCIDDGSLSKVSGTGSMVISKDLTLESVLLIPKLGCNLLSISKLTQEKNCLTKFFTSHCVFQDLNSGQTVSSTEMYVGLYIFRVANHLERQSQLTVCCKSFSVLRSNKDSEVILLHYRLGHPSF